ncbi:ATP synthase subunit B [Hirschfeldia incana]|nr:ATP synthase subunit B [Hirschfeldia incana]
MEELRRLEKLQSVVSVISSRGLLSSSSSSASDLDASTSSRFLSELVLFLVQPCGDLNIDSKILLVSDFIPKVSGPFLDEISSSIQRDDEAKPLITNSESQKSCAKRSFMDSADPHTLEKDQGVVAMVGLDAMKRANSTLEDFSRSYFMFHQLEISEPQSIFRYLPVLSFTESYIYQMDALNEKIVSESQVNMQSSSHGWNVESRVLFETDPLKPLGDVLEREGLLTQRIQQEFKSGKEYWALERKLCHALLNKNKICVEDVMRAIHLKSFDYRVLNLLLYKLRGVEVNELHMEFLSVSEFLVEVADDLFDYEDDVLENSFNVLRMFVGMFGPSNAPTELAKRISEAEEKYEEIMKSLDPHLSSKYQRRCEEATKEGGKVCGPSLGTWNIPAVISDEDAYRAAHR